MTDSSPFKDVSYDDVVAKLDAAAQVEFQRMVRDRALQIRVSREAGRQIEDEEATRSLLLPPDCGNLRDELAVAKPVPPFTIADLHPSGSNTLLAAQYKAGKTTLINNLSKALADGTPFLDRFEIQMPDQGGVAIWNYEVSQWQHEQWIGQLEIGSPERIWPYHLRGYRLPLTTKAGEEHAVRWLSERMILVWMIDPFAKAFDGEENSNSEVGRFLEALDVIKNRAGVRDLFLTAHTGRVEMEEGQERTRGATRLDDWADVRWMYSRSKPSNQRFLSADGRDVNVPEFGLTFDSSTRGLTAVNGSRREHQQRERWQVIVAAVDRRPGINKTTLKATIRGNGPQRQEVIDSCIRAGLLRVEEKSQSHLHYLTDSGERFLLKGLSDEG